MFRQVVAGVTGVDEKLKREQLRLTKGGRGLVWVEDAGHNLQFTKPEVIVGRGEVAA